MPEDGGEQMWGEDVGYLGFNFLLDSFYVSILPTCMSTYLHTVMSGACGGPKCFRFPGTGIMNSYEASWSCWELNPAPLEEQAVLLVTEPPLQPQETSTETC